MSRKTIDDGEFAGLEVEAEGDAWEDLVAALHLVKTKPSRNHTSPLHCEHDELTVMVDPGDFTRQELAQLDEWGFFVGGDDALTSFRFGSA